MVETVPRRLLPQIWWAIWEQTTLLCIVASKDKTGGFTALRQKVVLSYGTSMTQELQYSTKN